MQLDRFRYDLPNELIAQNPQNPRDEARLLVYNRKTRAITHSQVKHILEFIPAATTFVANNSKVRQARLEMLRATGKKVEVLLLEKIGSHWLALLRGSKFKMGEILSRHSLEATIVKLHEHQSMTTYELQFCLPPQELEELLEKEGKAPLPPYITKSTAEASAYQTVYASQLGSAAAPTAGLHFTPELLHNITTTGHAWQEVTLHVGMGTFLPLRNEILEKNELHSEKTWITPQVSAFISTHPPILAVGTTSTRTLESHYNPRTHSLTPGEQSTTLFIYPGYTFKVVNMLFTNFHLPGSSLLALVAAFLGTGTSLTSEEMADELMRIYALAVKERYRFFSFGDAMLIL